MAFRFLLAAGHAAFAFAVSLVASAQTEPNLAEALFLQARSDMKAGRISEACPRFRQSFDLVPTSGTLLNWAICEELLDQPALAWSKLQQFMAQVPADDPRISLAKSHIVRLEKDLCWLDLMFSAAPPPEAAIWLDDAELPRDRLGTWLPLLPGQHRVELRSPMQGVLKAEDVVLSAGQHHIITIVPPTPLVGPSAATHASVTSPAAPDARPLPQHQRSNWNQPLRNAFYVSGGIAVGALTASLAFGGLSLQAKNTVANHCEGRWCDHAGFRAAERGSLYVALADVTLVVGGVAALTSAGLFWIGSRQNVAMTVAPGATSLSYQSAF